MLARNIARLDALIPIGLANKAISREDLEAYADNIDSYIAAFANLGVPRSLADAAVLAKKLRDVSLPWNNFALREALEALNRSILQEAVRHKWLRIDSTYADHISNPKPWGEEVYAAFESAREDIVRARYAIAVDLPTASVFHAMRVAEVGLKWLARRLKVKLRENKKPFPVDEAVWNKIIDGVNGRIKVIRQKRAGPKKRELLERYANAAQQCDYMKDLWRNNVSHAHRSYSRLEAEAAEQRVRDFMQSLVMISSLPR
ncbi:MAG: hypothetical protein ACXW5U_22955 [Thermoanaerobaculia bacterium]